LSLWLATAWAAIASAQPSLDGPTPIDECGTLVRGAECVLFQGSSGRFVLAEFEGFQVGDLVRVVGTADPSCVTICGEGDGCIRGATIYDAVQVPCGSPIPNLPVDLCTSATAALTGALGAGFISMRRASRRSATRSPKR